MKQSPLWQPCFFIKDFLARRLNNWFFLNLEMDIFLFFLFWWKRPIVLCSVSHLVHIVQPWLDLPSSDRGCSKAAWLHTDTGRGAPLSFGECSSSRAKEWMKSNCVDSCETAVFLWIWLVYFPVASNRSLDKEGCLPWWIHFCSQFSLDADGWAGFIEGEKERRRGVRSWEEVRPLIHQCRFRCQLPDHSPPCTSRPCDSSRS